MARGVLALLDGAPLPAGLPPLYKAALRVVARDALVLGEGVF